MTESENYVFTLENSVTVVSRHIVKLSQVER